MEKLHDSFRLSKSSKHSNASFSFSCLELVLVALELNLFFFFLSLSPTYIFNSWTSGSDRCDFMPIPPFLYGFGQCKLLQQCW